MEDSCCDRDVTAVLLVDAGGPGSCPDGSAALAASLGASLPLAAVGTGVDFGVFAGGLAFLFSEPELSLWDTFAAFCGIFDGVLKDFGALSFESGGASLVVICMM